MADQAQGSASRIVIDSEASFGVAKETPAGIILPFVSETIKFSQPLEQSKTIRGDKNPSKGYLMNMDVSGDITVPVKSVSFGYMLKLGFSSFVSAGTTNYTHTAKIHATAAQPSFILEKKIPTAPAIYEFYTGCKIASMKYSFAPSGESLCTFSIIGKTMTSGDTPYMATPTAISETPFMNTQAVVKEGGSAIGTVKSLELTLNNDLDGDQYCIGGGGARGSIPEGLPQITGSMETLLTDGTLLAKADGATESSLEIEFTIDANTKLNLKMAELVYDKTGATPISGPKGLLFSPNFQAYYDNDAGASALTVVLSNAQASYWPST